VQDRRSLAWRLNWYRQSELEQALLLGQIVHLADDAYLIGRLTKHCADEARHARLWERTLLRLDLPPIRIIKSYQSFFVNYVNAPGSIAEVLAFTHVVEARARRQFVDDAARPGLPQPVRRTLAALIRDEQEHLDWVAGWLSAQSAAGVLLDSYKRADEEVYRYLLPFDDRLWDIPGIGEELTDLQPPLYSIRVADA